tara:strand:- start:3966 stop:4265 length:300 start_codon:yes stop_codon:yes gene_type:complete
MSDNYDKLLGMWREEKKKRQEAEGETTIVKGIGMNSPEMRAIKTELSEVKEDNKKLVRQVEDQREISRGHQLQNGKLHVEITESQKKECKCNTKTSTSS